MQIIKNANKFREENKTHRINPRKDSVDFTTFQGREEYLIEEIKSLEEGDYSIVTRQSDVEKVLNCFDTAKDFVVTKLSNNYYGILPALTTTYVLNIYKKLILE